MQRFDENRPCPKCGGVARTRHSSVALWPHGKPLFPESLLRTCIRCGYQWHERPLDAEEDE